MPKLLRSALWAGVLVAAALDVHAAEVTDVLSWSRMSADKFGCYLEKTFGYKDAKFNCSLHRYVNNGDPCENTDAYYEGPKFPESLVRKVHPKAKRIILSWEQGELQSFGIFFDKEFTDEEIRQSFNLPEKSHHPENIISIDTDYCTRPCLSVIGFDHMGATDVECP